MSTLSVKQYEEQIEAERKDFVRRNLSNFNRVAHSPLAAGDISEAKSIVKTLIEKGLPTELVNQVALSGITMAISKYSWRGTRHSSLAREMIVESDRGLFRAIEGTPTSVTIDNIKGLLETGVLRQTCNPKGNYANLCRAIVNTTRDLDAWTFSTQFTIALRVASHTKASGMGLFAEARASAGAGSVDYAHLVSGPSV